MTALHTQPLSTEAEAQIQRDTALLLRIASKDAAAFHEFHRLHANLVFATVSQVLNNPHDAEDIMQDVMVMIWQKAHLYEPRKGKPLTWVISMARNRAIDRLRSKQRRSRLYDDFESENKQVQPEFAESAADHLADRERYAVVHRALSQLQPDQREAVQLAFLGGLSQADVARKLRQPLGTVKARIRRGVSRMEGLVKEYL